MSDHRDDGEARDGAQTFTVIESVSFVEVSGSCERRLRSTDGDPARGATGMISLRVKLRSDKDGKATRRSSLERRRVGPPLWFDFQWRIGFGEFRFDTPQLAVGSFIYS